MLISITCWPLYSCFPSFVHEVKQELNFHDKDTQFYRFRESECSLKSITNERDVEEELQEGLSLLSQLGPDALLTMILRKWSVCPTSRHQ